MTEGPTPPANATEASARLGVLTADKAWSDRVLGGDLAAAKELHDLTTIISEGGDDIDRALAGVVLGDVPDSGAKLMAETATWMRGRGLSDGVIRQQLSGQEVTAQEFRTVENWKAQQMRSPEFTKAFLADEPGPVREMLLADIVLSSNIKSEAAA